MTHDSEQDFESHVEAQLIEEYGADNVARQHRFDDDNRVADIVVTDDWVTWTYELENDAGSVVNGSGQANYYAQHYPNAVPVLAIPVGHIDPPERHYIEQTPVIVREFEY